MPIQSSFFRSIACLMAITAASVAGSDDETHRNQVEAIPPTVVTIATSATVRIIIVEEGWDHISHRVFVQWLGEVATPHEEKRIIATKSVEELSGGLWRVYEPEFIDPVTIRVAVYSRLSDKKRMITIKASSPGSVSIEGDLVISEKELEEERQPNQALQTTSVTRSAFGKVPVSDRQSRGV